MTDLKRDIFDKELVTKVCESAEQKFTGYEKHRSRCDQPKSEKHWLPEAFLSCSVPDLQLDLVLANGDNPASEFNPDGVSGTFFNYINGANINKNKIRYAKSFSGSKRQAVEATLLGQIWSNMFGRFIPPRSKDCLHLFSTN